MKMSLISDIALFLLWIFTISPVYFIDKFIEDLPITSDPDTSLIPPQIIRQRGYIAESHTIQTDDGYLLELHRIPYGQAGKSDKERYPILIYHGVLCNSGAWLINEAEKSLPLRLADEGYDVWLGNIRGNTFSNAHVKYNPSQKEFWNFSAHDPGVYDVPASIDYILNQTNHRQLVYICHSLGCTLFFMATSVLPEYNDKILTQVGLAPGVPIPHTKSPFFRILAPVAEPLYDVFEEHGAGSFFEHDVIEEMIDQEICSIPFFGTLICKFAIFFSFGEDLRQLNDTVIPAVINSVMDGTSVKLFVHILQWVNSGKLANYDYGKTKNLQQYGSPKPPLYNINNTKVSVRFYYSDGDEVVDPTDLKAFHRKLPNPDGFVKVDDPLFSHLDFLVAKDINRLVYDDVIQYVRNFTDTISDSLFTPNMIFASQNNENDLPAASVQRQSFPETVVSVGNGGSSENITIFLPAGST